MNISIGELGDENRTGGEATVQSKERGGPLGWFWGAENWQEPFDKDK